nr:hypothetical protein [Tanacetum cinerariifolium]
MTYRPNSEGSSAPSPKPSNSSRSHTSTRHKGKEIAKPITPLSETASEEDSDPEQAQRDKDMQNNLALIAKYFKKIYKPTNNNLRISSNSKNKNVDTATRYKNDDHSRQFGTQRTVNVAGTRKKVGSPVVQKSRIQCFNCKEYGHFAKECRKPKRVKDSAYHKKKMLLCNQAEQGVLLQAEQYDCYMAKIQEVLTVDSSTDSEPLEQNEQNDVDTDDERVTFANLIANLKLDVDENKKIQKQLKKANTTLAQELKECKAILAETSKSLGSLLVSEIVAWLHFRPSRLSLRSLRPLMTVPLTMTNLNTKSVTKANVSEGLSKPVTVQTLPQTAKKAVRVSDKPNVSRPQLKSNQSRDKVLPNNSQVKVKKTQVEVRPRIPSVSNKIKSVTTCKDSLNSRTLNANAVYATCNKCLVDSNHFACVTKMLNDVHARTKKPNVVPISTRKPKSQANKSIATPHKEKVASKSTNQKPQSYFRIVQLILFIVDSGCTKHMTGNLKLLCNFIEKFLGTVHFGNEQFAPILGYGDLVQGNVTINRVYYVEGFNHNLFSVGQFCDVDLEATPTQAWLWHRRLSHLNFDYINLLSKKDIVIGLPKLKYVKYQLCSSCELSRAKRSSFKSKVVLRSKGRLNLLHIDLCGPMRVASINGKKYILNRALVEAARTMISASQLPLFFWAEAIATACYTQNRSIIIPAHDKTPYHIINDRKPSIKHLHIFGCICYITRDGKNLDKMKEKGDSCIMVGYSIQSKGYRLYNKRTRMIVESIHIRIDEIKEVSETSVANNTSGLVPQRQKASDYDNPDPVPQRQDVYSLADADVPSQQELDLLFGPLYDELC